MPAGVDDEVVERAENAAVPNDVRQLRACQRCHLVLPAKQFYECVRPPSPAICAPCRRCHRVPPAKLLEQCERPLARVRPRARFRHGTACGPAHRARSRVRTHTHASTRARARTHARTRARIQLVPVTRMRRAQSWLQQLWRPVRHGHPCVRQLYRRGCHCEPRGELDCPVVGKT